jgi:catechol 2,3-dioxygenase-like lactoylglutathione lyase family enzyme
MGVVRGSRAAPPNLSECEAREETNVWAMGVITMPTPLDAVLALYPEPIVHRPLADYFRENEAARRFVDLCAARRWPVRVDHLTVRCLDIERRAAPFLAIGYEDRREIVDYPDQGWWAKVYRKPGYPALFLDQAYPDERGKKSFLPAWVKLFGEECFHHVAVRVDDIDAMMAAMQAEGIEFSGAIVGAKGTRLRQIFTAAEQRKGQAYSVLELAERNGYEGFVPEQADGLMQASVMVKKKGKVESG